MKKIIYSCDYCGKEITEKVYTFVVGSRDGEGICLSDSPLGSWDPDICENCLDRFLMAVRPGKILPEAEEKKTDKQIDMAKVFALRNAGWSLEKIGKEFGVSGQTIANRIAKNGSMPEGVGARGIPGAGVTG